MSLLETRVTAFEPLPANGRAEVSTTKDVDLGGRSAAGRGAAVSPRRRPVAAAARPAGPFSSPCCAGDLLAVLDVPLTRDQPDAAILRVDAPRIFFGCGAVQEAAGPLRSSTPIPLPAREAHFLLGHPSARTGCGCRGERTSRVW